MHVPSATLMAPAPSQKAAPGYAKSYDMADTPEGVTVAVLDADGGYFTIRVREIVSRDDRLARGLVTPPHGNPVECRLSLEVLTRGVSCDISGIAIGPVEKVWESGVRRV